MEFIDQAPFDTNSETVPSERVLPTLESQRVVTTEAEQEQSTEYYH